MPFFGKKKKNDANDNGGKDNKQNKKSNVSMKRKGKGHALTISVPESATELMQDNAPFIINGKTVGAAVAISEAIGDLSDKKNVDVGQIVNYINHGTISAIVLEPLLNDDTIIIIPDSSTIGTMRSYDSFKNAEYELCYVDLSEGKISPCFEEEKKISFSDLENISNGREDLGRFLGISSTSAASSNSDDFDDFDDDDDELSDPLYSDQGGDYGGDYGDEFGGELDNNEFDSPADDSFDGADFDNPPEDIPQTNDYPSEPFMEPEPEPEPEDPFEETTQETISQTAMRTFMVDDIQIDVSDEPFNMQFNASDLVLFSEQRPTDEGDGISNHLNECLNNMSKAANAEIKQARTAHLNELRTEYMNALGEFVRTCINSELSTFGDTASAQERHAIEENHQNLLNNIENEVNERKANIDREYNEAIVNVRNAAAEAAEHEYRENHQKQYIAQIDAIRNVVEQEIENQYINDIAAQNENRHKVALELLDDAMVSILEQLTVKYADMMVDERAIYQKHMESMLEFMSHQRYNEMNRIRVLHDEHARVDIAEKMSAKHAADVADITAKFNAQKRALEADLQAMRSNLDVAINRATAEAERTIANLKLENQRLSESAEKAMSKLDSADERAQSKYEHEIESLHTQISHWENESIKLHDGQKTATIIMLGLAVAAVIAAGAIGFISGQSHQAKAYANMMRMESSYDVPANQSGNTNENQVQAPDVQQQQQSAQQQSTPEQTPAVQQQQAAPINDAPQDNVNTQSGDASSDASGDKGVNVSNDNVGDDKTSSKPVDVDDIDTTSGSVQQGN